MRPRPQGGLREGGDGEQLHGRVHPPHPPPADAWAPAPPPRPPRGSRAARQLFRAPRAAGRPAAASLSDDALAELKALARAWERAADGESGDEEHDAAFALADAVLALPGGPPDPDD